MATSGVVTLSTSQDALIRRAFRLLGLIQVGGTRYPEEMDNAAEALNSMLKEWDSQGVGLWLIKPVTLYPQMDSASYNLGPSGDHATLSGVSTETSAAASSGASTISVDSATGIADTYYIGVELDSGSFQWTTVNGTPPALVVTLDDVLTDDVDDGATVVCYQTKIARPLRIKNPRYKNSSGYERPLDLLSRSEYQGLTDKTTAQSDGPTAVYYDPQLTNGKLYVWPVNSNVDGEILFDAEMPMEILSARTDEPLVANEWQNTIALNLAALIGLEYPLEVSKQHLAYVDARAREAFMKLKRWDEEVTSLFLGPDLSMGGYF
ncbi:MAG: hypothetical protein C4542_08155 [Dehalococcoidia bacterium]|nr:MAG: hypothetical protein C4542_08155 [Dehalococcoidia bacterium]